MPLTKTVFIIVLSVYFSSCNSVGDRSEKNSIEQPDSIRISTFRVNDGYGYEIFLNDTKVVYQPTIPVIEGNATFPTKELAFKTAVLVSSKIRKGITPPSISSEELEILFKTDNY